MDLLESCELVVTFNRASAHFKSLDCLTSVMLLAQRVGRAAACTARSSARRRGIAHSAAAHAGADPLPIAQESVASAGPSWRPPTLTGARLPKPTLTTGAETRFGQYERLLEEAHDAICKFIPIAPHANKATRALTTHAIGAVLVAEGAEALSVGSGGVVFLAGLR